MPSVKTAISLQKPLFEKVNGLAKELKISRSQLFAIALEEYITHYQNQMLLNNINAAYDDQPDETEIEQQRLMKQKQLQFIMAEDRW